ncbi:MAG: 6-carboxytetrahydropterin synthase QueD [Chthoniobacterales bacterium]|nr:6-carboxytetrahydropterin synthase QueD [Chthoniobacterales bacterium]
MTATLTKTFHFEAAHTLPRVAPDHQCARMHGHSYKVEISVTGPVGSDTGWVMDHAEIGAAAKPLIARLDHRYLNDIPGLENPTFENIAAWLWRELKPSIPLLSAISVHETPTSCCVYRG